MQLAFFLLVVLDVGFDSFNCRLKQLTNEHPVRNSLAALGLTSLCRYIELTSTVIKKRLVCVISALFLYLLYKLLEVFVSL